MTKEQLVEHLKSSAPLSIDWVRCPNCGGYASKWIESYTSTRALVQALETHVYSNCTGPFIDGQQQTKADIIRANLAASNACEAAVKAGYWEMPPPPPTGEPAPGTQQRTPPGPPPARVQASALEPRQVVMGASSSSGRPAEDDDMNSVHSYINETTDRKTLYRIVEKAIHRLNELDGDSSAADAAGGV